MSSRSKHDVEMLLLSAKAGLLGIDVIPALKLLAGLSAHRLIVAEDTLHKLERLNIGRKDVNILDGKEVFILSGFGKKVIAVMKENPTDFPKESGI